MFHIFYYRAVGMLYCNIPAGWNLIRAPKNSCAFFFQINLEFIEKIYRKVAGVLLKGFKA